MFSAYCTSITITMAHINHLDLPKPSVIDGVLDRRLPLPITDRFGGWKGVQARKDRSKEWREKWDREKNLKLTGVGLCYWTVSLHVLAQRKVLL